MGTNYYIGDTHIGKIMVAGEYCYKCEITLCVDGKEKVHSGATYFMKTCPICNNRKHVDITSSFTWAIHPSKFLHIRINREKIKDEYNRKITFTNFCELLNNCKIQFYDSIGHNFS